MKYLIFPLLLLVILQNSSSIYAENQEYTTENRSNSTSKIPPIIIQWQDSENPSEFAQQKNLSYNGEKIAVYIILDTEESRNKIPPGIEITASEEKTVAAFVNSDEIEKLIELSFVERITLPDYARNPPFPQPQTQTVEASSNEYILWIVFVGVAIFIGIFLFKRKNQKHAVSRT